MGWLSGLRLALGIGASSNVIPFPSGGGGKVRGFISPWQEGSLSPIIASDIWGLEAAPLSREEALRVPAIAKGRAVLHSLIASRPLKQLDDDDEESPRQPTWLSRSNTGVNPYMRNTLMLDDHIFNEATLLKVQRGKSEQILDALHIPYDDWWIDEKGRAVILDEVQSFEEVVWIPGPGPGLLVTAAEHIRAARSMDVAWAGRVRNPIPLMVLQETEPNGVADDTERDELLGTFRRARQDPEGALGFLPSYLNLLTPGADSNAIDLFEKGRNALRIDFANFLNLPVAILDGSLTTASLTYSTQEGRRNEVFDYTVGYWTNPIEQALSQDNVCPRGTRIRFDFSDLLSTAATPTGPEARD